MTRNAARTYIIIMGAFSTVVAFIGELATDDIRSALLMAIFVALLFVLVGTVGLRMFWKNEERGK